VPHHLTCSIVESLAVITLSNPPQNRLTEQMIGELDSAITAIAHNGARAVLVNADGDNFSYGGDVSPWPDMDAPELRALFERYMTVFNSFERLPIPVIAAVQGLCLGGGFELILRSDVVFATPSTYFGHPEKTLGLVTLLGGIYRVAERVGRNKAIEWALTGERLPASVMADAGIVNHIVDEDNLVHVATDSRVLLRLGLPAHTRHTRRCCAHGRWAASPQPTKPSSTSRCRCSTPPTPGPSSRRVCTRSPMGRHVPTVHSPVNRPARRTSLGIHTKEWR